MKWAHHYSSIPTYKANNNIVDAHSFSHMSENDIILGSLAIFSWSWIVVMYLVSVILIIGHSPKIDQGQ